ncbi:MAG TPA: hypothetical protein PLE19_09140 [Planctomycetota bacterium]|nr:hypothetical protein [Planctomycetota bacterium]HRR79167.1 hypothetical protein [Planctomycetota bacterium]HRT93966.1 hypothetical protein [Planctomycetota bacterium]
MESVRAFAGKVAARLGAQALLDAAGLWLCLGAGAAAAALLAERLASLGANPGLLVAVPLLASGLGALAAGLARWPSLHEAALRADERFHLAERLSTALAAPVGPMADLVRADAARHIATVDLSHALPLRLPRSVRLLAVLALVLLAAALAPQADLFGWGAQRAARAAERADVRRATEAARASLARLAAAGRAQGLNQPTQVLDQLDRTLAGLEAGEPTAAEARREASKAAGSLAQARASNDAALASPAAPADRARLENERDLLAGAARILEGWERALAAGSRGGTSPTAKGSDRREGGGSAERAPDLVRPQEAAPPPREAVKVESRLVAARPAAEAATRADDIPWLYRTAVRRYFSPDEPGP